MSERRSSAKSKKKRTTEKASRSSANNDVQSREEDENIANDEELEAPDDMEYDGEVETLSAEEEQVLGDLETLELVLEELVNRRKQGSVSLSADDNPTPPTGSSAASDVTRVSSSVGSAQTDTAEQELVQEDVDRLDRFLDQLDDQRAHGKKTPPGRPTITTPPDPANTRGSIIKYENLKDSRLSHIVSIDDEITEELNKVHAELRKAKPKRSSRKTGTASESGYRRPSPSLASSSSLSSHSHSTTGEVNEGDGGLYGGEPAAESSQGEQASWFSFDGFNMPTGTSSMETLAPSQADLMVQYNADFRIESPSGSTLDPFIHKTIQRILDLKTSFPDENLYLIPSSSLPPDDLPHLSSLFQVATVAHTDSQMLQEPSHSVIPPLKKSQPGLNKRASGEIDTLSEGARVKRELGDLGGQTLVDYLGGSQTTLETDDKKVGLPNSPSDGRISVKEKGTARNDNSVAPDKVREQKARRSVSPPAPDHKGPRRESTSPAIATLPSVLSATMSPRSEADKDVEVLPEQHHQSDVMATETPRQSESPDAASALKSSLRNASATQGTVKQKPAAVADPAVPTSSDKVESVELSSNVSSLVKKKVSFADMNSTMYILVNPSSEVLETTSSRESIGSQTGCCSMSDISVVQATPADHHHHHKSGLGAKARNSLAMSRCDCKSNPSLCPYTPTTSPTRSGLTSSCCAAEEAHHPSSEALADLGTSCHAITGSITHVICRVRSAAEQGCAIIGSRDRWVTRVNSRGLSFPMEDVVAVCPSCGNCESFPTTTTSECIVLHAPCPPSSTDVAAAAAMRRPQASCSLCPMMNTNYSCCSESRHAEEEESDSLQTSVSEHTPTGSCLGDTADEGGGGGGGSGGPVSSSGRCDIAAAASESRNNDACSTVSVVFNVRDRNRSRNTISEK